MRFNQIPSNAGLGLEMKVIASVVVGGAAITGGRGSAVGTLLGVVLLGAIGPALTFLGVSVYWERAIQGAIVLAVVGNTMAMIARERLAEYATLKTLGFGPGFVSALVLGESLAVAAAGGLVGVAATFPVARVFAAQTGTLFSTFEVSAATVEMQVGCAVLVGLGAALLPARRAASVRIVDGLRAIG